MSNKGAVLLVANYASDVGYAWWLMENFWAVIAREMHKQGRECLLAYPTINTVPEVVKSAPIRLIERHMRPSSFRDALEGARFIRRHGIRSVYLTDWGGLSWVYLLWRLAGVRSIVLHDHTPGDRPVATGPRAWLKSFGHKLSFLSCTLYVGVSDYIRRRFSENWRVPPQRCAVVRNGIREFACDGSRRNVRESLGISEDAVIAVLVSRATRYKGWDFAVKCMQQIVAAHPALDLHFVFCGDGPQLEEFREAAAQGGVAQRAHFLGRRSDVRAILCASDFAFHPSRGEAMSLAILEFMCAGLGVIVSDLPSVCGTIEHGKTGLIYRAEDVQSAVDALVSMASDRSRRAQIGANARSVMLAEYRLESTNDALLATVVPAL